MSQVDTRKMRERRTDFAGRSWWYPFRCLPIDPRTRLIFRAGTRRTRQSAATPQEGRDSSAQGQAPEPAIGNVGSLLPCQCFPGVARLQAAT